MYEMNFSSFELISSWRERLIGLSISLIGSEGRRLNRAMVRWSMRSSESTSRSDAFHWRNSIFSCHSTEVDGSRDWNDAELSASIEKDSPGWPNSGCWAEGFSAPNGEIDLFGTNRIPEPVAVGTADERA